jgi:hypothetical protein
MHGTCIKKITDLHRKAQTKDNALQFNLQKYSNWQLILLQSTDILICITVEFKSELSLC